MNIPLAVKKLLIVISLIAIAVIAFLFNALSSFSTHPIAFSEPPKFVEKYASALKGSSPTPISTESKSVAGSWTTELSKEEALVRKVFFDGASTNLLIPLFRSPVKSQRVKIALAFSNLNVEYTHDEDSGVPEKVRQFWQQQEIYIDDIRNALFEALIVSAEENTSNYIPYTLAWMPGRGVETVEVFAWAAKHHSDWWIRRFAVYFVAEFGQVESLTDAVLISKAKDPDYRVRKEVLGQRFNKLIGG